MKLIRIFVLISLIFVPLGFIRALARSTDAPLLLATPTPIPTPVLLAPAAGSTPLVIRPVFDWTDVAGATEYEIVVSIYSNYAWPLVDATPPTSTFTPIADLTRNITTYWRVRVISPFFSPWVSSYFISPNPPYSPAPLTPGLDAIVTDYTPTLTWAASVIPAGTALAYYQLQVDDNQDFSSLMLDNNTLNLAYTFPSDLAPNSTYYWRIRAVNTLGQYSMWRTSSFNAALLPPTLLSPAFQEVTGLRPILDWNDVPGASGYGVEVSVHPDFSSPLVSLAVSASTYFPTADLPANTVIYWRVRTHGTFISAWSSSSFTASNAPITPTPSPTPSVTPVAPYRLYLPIIQAVVLPITPTP